MFSSEFCIGGFYDLSSVCQLELCYGSVVVPEEYFQYLLELVENIPQRYRDEVVSEAYLHVAENSVDLDSKPNARKYLYNLVYKKAKRLADSRGHKQLSFDVSDDPERIDIFKLRIEDLEEGIRELDPLMQRVIRESLVASNQVEASANLGISQARFSKTRTKAIKILSKWVQRNMPDFTDLL